MNSLEQRMLEAISDKFIYQEGVANEMSKACAAIALEEIRKAINYFGNNIDPDEIEEYLIEKQTNRLK